jgi:hypothetical protein
MSNPYGIPDEVYQSLGARARLTASGYKNKVYGDSIYRSNLANLISDYTKNNPTGASTGEAGAGSASNQSASSSSFSGLQGSERDTVKGLLDQFNNGGTDAYKEAQAQRQQTIGMLDASLQDYSKKGAFQDAVDLMASNLNKSMEANKPMIGKAVEGAGTSAGSMQALLAQKLSTDASREAGAMGAQQAVAYGQIASNLLNQRGSLTTGVDQRMDPMIKLADLLKVQTSQQQSSGSSNFDPANMLNAEANMARVSAANPPKAYSTYGGPPLQDMVAGSGLGNGGAAPTTTATDWYTKAVADINKKKPNYGDTGFYSVPDSGGFGANWYDQSQA